MSPLTVFAIIEVPDADLARVHAAVAALARQSIREGGCLRYDVYQSRKDPVRLVIHEEWADDIALQRHRGAAHVADFKLALDGTTAHVWASPCDMLP